jgi:hypothetical protein
MPHVWNQHNINAIWHHYKACPISFVEFIIGLKIFVVSDDAKDTDSLSDEVTHNSNQNNSNCSSPSRMSDSVSLNTDSSQDTSLCSPLKQTHIDINSKIRFVNIGTKLFTCIISRINKVNNKYMTKHKEFPK